MIGPKVAKSFYLQVHRSQIHESEPGSHLLLTVETKTRHFLFSLLIEDLCGKNLFSKILNVQKMLEKEKEAVRNELLFKEKVFLNSGSPERTVEHLQQFLKHN